MLSVPMLDIFPALVPFSPARASIWACRLLKSDFSVDESANKKLYYIYYYLLCKIRNLSFLRVKFKKTYLPATLLAILFFRSIYYTEKCVQYDKVFLLKEKRVLLPSTLLWKEACVCFKVFFISGKNSMCH